MVEALEYRQGLRRRRQSQAIRELCREVHLVPQNFIQPYFVVEDLKASEALPLLPGNYRDNLEALLPRLEKDIEAGSTKALLFAVPRHKSSHPEDFDFTVRAIEAIKKHFGSALWLAVDVCLCSHTSHGHCGIMNDKASAIQNHASVLVLQHQALIFAAAGADCVAPSDMMDHRIAAIRQRLDEARLDDTLIMSYAAKFHSTYYKPFRAAADSTPAAGTLRDRSSYQIDPAMPEDAFLAAERDLREGADILMVKPAGLYLDIIARISRELKAPCAAYQVSGEYAAIELLSREGMIDREEALRESWIAIRRAGAEILISYAAREARQILQRG